MNSSFVCDGKSKKGTEDVGVLVKSEGGCGGIDFILTLMSLNTVALVFI